MSTAVRQVAKGYLCGRARTVFGTPGPSGVQGQNIWWGLRAFAPEADNMPTLVVKMCYFVTVLTVKNDSDICIH